MSRAEARKKSKKKSSNNTVYYVIMIILFAIMGFSGFKVYKIASEYKQGTSVYDGIAEDVGAAPREQAHLDMRLTLDWDKLSEKNSDIVGWIRSQGTVINYPVVKGIDNEYYLNHLLDGTWNNKGTIFLDMRSADPFNDFLTVMYGHRMKDKSMFYLLGEYFEHKSTPYFLEHPVIELYTPEKDYDIQIFGAAVIDSRDESLYNFRLYEKEEKQRYIDWIFAHNELAGYDNRVSVTTSDHIVMMSTCTLQGSANDNNRVVVWGKLVEVDRDSSGE